MYVFMLQVLDLESTTLEAWPQLALILTNTEQSQQEVSV